MKIRPTKGLTFDDVLLVPKRSPVASRQNVDTSTSLTSQINLQVPIISANMDTVTETAMAIAMARTGGMGIIHRFMTIERQADQVRQVKRAQGFIVEHPYSIQEMSTAEEAEKLMSKYNVGGLVVLDERGEMAGLITQRDILLAPEELTLVGELMTRLEDIVSAPTDVTPEQARTILYRHRIEKLPVIDADGKLHGLITARDVMKAERYPQATKDSRERLRVGAAIGVSAREIERAAVLLEAGVDVLVLDIAHGHADHCIEMIKELRKSFPQAQIVAGNVATRQGARDLAEVGADAIKVGIGPGSICTTRIVTGFGVPQLTAILDSVAGLEDAGVNIPIIADGGIRTSGDMVKALAAGASTVMIGGLFSGCEEAPGAPVIRNGQKVKVVRGMASLGAAIGRKEAEMGRDESAEDQEDWSKVIPEGVEAVVPYRGYVHEIVYQLVGGLRSGLSYGGACNIHELQKNAEFMEITPAGVRESRSHDVNQI